MGNQRLNMVRRLPIPERDTTLHEKDICVKLVLERGVRSPNGQGVNWHVLSVSGRLKLASTWGSQILKK